MGSMQGQEAGRLRHHSNEGCQVSYHVFDQVQRTWVEQGASNMQTADSSAQDLERAAKLHLHTVHTARMKPHANPQSKVEQLV